MCPPRFSLAEETSCGLKINDVCGSSTQGRRRLSVARDAWSGLNVCMRQRLSCSQGRGHSDGRGLAGERRGGVSAQRGPGRWQGLKSCTDRRHMAWAVPGVTPVSEKSERMRQPDPIEDVGRGEGQGWPVAHVGVLGAEPPTFSWRTGGENLDGVHVGT